MRPSSSCTMIVDAGGSWTRIIIQTESGRLINFSKIPSNPKVPLRKILKRALMKKKRTRISTLIIGAKGIWTRQEKKTLRRQLDDFAPKVMVCSDIEMAYAAFFAHSHGILLLAGTGSICYGRAPDGKRARTGGLGPARGDEGSGYWIGKMFLSRKFRSPSKDKSVREVAQRAPVAVKQAKKNDPVSVSIISEAHRYLLDLLSQTVRELGFRGAVPVSFSGGLFSNRFFKDRFVSALGQSPGGKDFKIIESLKASPDWIKEKRARSNLLRFLRAAHAAG